MPDDEDVEARPDIPLKRVTTDELFDGTREIAIEHNGESYRLRVTARGRLILTK